MKLKCPACTAELTPYKCGISTLEIDSCFYCRGLWFDGNELRRFFSAPKLYSQFRLPQHNFRVKIKEPPARRLCARCEEQPLTEVTVGDVVVDECQSCQGIWLDSGEITRLIDLHEDKGLKGKSETAKQIRKGKFDQSALGQASHVVSLAFKALVKTS